jgi:hypothetical protein
MTRTSAGSGPRFASNLSASGRSAIVNGPLRRAKPQVRRVRRQGLEPRTRGLRVASAPSGLVPSDHVLPGQVPGPRLRHVIAYQCYPTSLPAICQHCTRDPQPPSVRRRCVGRARCVGATYSTTSRAGSTVCASPRRLDPASGSESTHRAGPITRVPNHRPAATDPRGTGEQGLRPTPVAVRHAGLPPTGRDHLGLRDACQSLRTPCSRAKSAHRATASAYTRRPKRTSPASHSVPPQIASPPRGQRTVPSGSRSSRNVQTTIGSDRDA